MNPEKWKNIKGILSATLDLPEKARAEFLAKADSDVRFEVEKLLLAHKNAGGFIVDSIMIEQGLAVDELKDDLVGSIIENYLILERIGTGGMGAVYLAERLNSDFKQKVALKIIKRGMDSEAILQRFAFERRILSTLKHTNIAQLLDGGISSEGLPFFVMEYIDGKPLKKFCDENNLPLKERLELFCQICEAVEYAHKNLVVHRDLKPANILVTNDGIPKLLDFGIAKLLSNEGDGATLTATNGRVFTPEYASPEQVLGKQITTGTDVYSLGILLYELLSGHRPFETRGKSFEEIVKSVCETEPIKPSEAITEFKSVETKSNNPNEASGNPQLLRGDLDNIILKALRKEPTERYGSVQQFSEDILRFLKGLPVLARPNTLKYRFGKYFKRHKAGVLAAAMVLVSLLGGTSVAVWQAIEAGKERAKAEQRFNDVRKLANSVVFEFHDSIKNLSGSTPARELLISRGLEYLDKLASESDQDLFLQSELADAYQRIGDIQGGFNSSHLGQREKAFESYSKALAIREKLISSEPSNVEFRRKLAESHGKMSDALWVKTDLSGSLQHQQKAFEIRQKLGDEFPNDIEIRFELGMDQSNLGRLLGANGQTEESLTNARQAAQSMEVLTANEPGNRKIMQGLAICYDRLSEILRSLTENYSEARSLNLKSQEISLKLLENNPQDVALRRSVAVGYLDIGNVSAKLNDYQTALENLQKSLTMFENLSSEDPENEEFKQIVAAVETEFCFALIKTGKASEAVVRLKKSLITLQKLKAQSPTDEIVHFRMASVYEYLGKGYVTLATEKNSAAKNNLINWQEAIKYLQKGYEIYKVFSDEGKTVGDEAAKMDELSKEIENAKAEISKAR